MTTAGCLCVLGNAGMLVVAEIGTAATRPIHTVEQLGDGRTLGGRCIVELGARAETPHA